MTYNIPGSVSEIGEGEGGDSAKYTVGRNLRGEAATYAGPKPPPGHGPHRYYFVLFALDSSAGLPEGLSLREFVAAAEPHVVGMTRLVGVYETR